MKFSVGTNKPRTALGASALVAAVLATACLLAAPTAAWAQQKHKYFFKAPPGTSKYTQQHTIDVRDVAGHQIRVGELHSKWGAEAPEFDGVKATESWAALMTDYINTSGRLMVYTVMLMANGDRIYTRSEGTTLTSVASGGSRKIAFSTVGAITGGTGKFATLRGVLRSTGFSDLKTGTSGNVTEGEYWFDKGGI